MAEPLAAEYEKLAEKYKLPMFGYLDNEFEIFDLDNEKYLLRAIKARIVGRLDDYVKILEDTLYPDSSSYSSIYETRVLTEEDKGKILRVHQQFMILLRKALHMSVDNKEDIIAGFIKEACEVWEDQKTPLRQIAEKLKIAWETEKFDQENISYMG